MKKFTEFNLHPDVQRGIDAAGFEFCTPVQEQTFDAIFSGRDVTVKSQTGTGKTAAFLISLFQTLLDERQAREAASKVAATSQEDGSELPPNDQVLILAPTRELVVQIEEEAKVLGEFLDIKFATIYGGVGYNKQEAELAADPDIIVATPGRLMDFMQSRKIDNRRFGFLVIDEADRMFDMGFYPDIQKILRGMRPPVERRTLLFSATLSTRVLNIAWDHMNDPADIEIEPEHITVDAIDQTLYHVSRDEKMALLLGLIAKHKPESALFFTNTKRMAEELSNRLRANNFTAEFIMGDLPQKKRLNIINAVKRKEIRFLVATDVAARGLHIDDLQMVFNYDLPEDSENYVHRIGRTARAGNTGKAISLADEHSVYNLSSIESYIGIKIPVEAVSDDLLAEDLSRGMRMKSEYYESRRDRGSSSGRRGEGSRNSRSSGSRSSGASPARGGQKNRRSGAASDSQGRQSKPEQQRSGERRRSEFSRRPSASKPVSKMSKEERLAYYADKYGEDFGQKGSKQGGRKGAQKGKQQSGQRTEQRMGQKAKNTENSSSPKGQRSKGKQGNRSKKPGEASAVGSGNQQRSRSKSQANRGNNQKNRGGQKASNAQNANQQNKKPQKQEQQAKKNNGIGGFFKRLFGGE